MVLELVPSGLTLDFGVMLLAFETELSPSAAQTALEELRETPELAAESLASLKEILREEEDLTLPEDDGFLIAFLRPCHWYPESAADRIRNFYKFMSQYPHLSEKLLPSTMGAIIHERIFTALPRRDQLGRRILVLQTGTRWNVKRFSIDQLLRATIMCLEIAIVEPDTQISGGVIIWDLEGLSLKQVLKFSPSFGMKLMHWIQDCVPLRLKAIHFVNQSGLFDIGFRVIKPFLKEKLRNRIYFHGRNYDTLLEHIDAKSLPTKYGGDLDMIEPLSDEVLQHVIKFEEYFQEMSKYGYPPAKN